MKFQKEMLLLYAVTDRVWTGEKTLYAQVEEVLEGGATMVQLREKKISTEELIREAAGMRELCHRYGVPLIVNDNVEAAIKSGADGVHVGMEDMPVKDIRAMAGKDFIIGATAKTVEQARIGQTDDVQDFINPIIRQPQHRCPHFQIFVCGQVFVQGRRFNQCTDLCQIAALPRMAVKLNTAGSGPQNTCNHF